MTSITINQGIPTERVLTVSDLPELQRLAATKEIYVIFKGVVIFDTTLLLIISKLK
jgi:hypothetical protein